MVYGVMFSFGSICQIINSVLVEFIFKDIGFDIFYYVCACLSTISLLLLVFLFKEEKFC